MGTSPSSVEWKRKAGGELAVTCLSLDMESNRATLGAGLVPSKASRDCPWVKADCMVMTGYPSIEKAGRQPCLSMESSAPGLPLS